MWLSGGELVRSEKRIFPFVIFARSGSARSGDVVGG